MTRCIRTFARLANVRRKIQIKQRSSQKIDNDDQVWLDVGQVAAGTTAKLSYLNNGPYNVEKVNNNNTVDIVHAENSADKHKVNISRLRKQKKRDEDLKIQPLPSIDSTPETDVTPATKTTAVVRASLEMPTELSETLQQIRKIIARLVSTKLPPRRKSCKAFSVLAPSSSLTRNARRSLLKKFQLPDPPTISSSSSTEHWTSQETLLKKKGDGM